MADKKDNTTNKLSKDAPKGEKTDLGLLEEDDEFEEFPTEVWESKGEDDDELNIWDDNWDDDNIEDDFTQQLKNELQKQKLDSTEPMKT